MQRPAPLPVRVRLARAEDEAQILTFASDALGGWDYIPYVWKEWLAATDGVLLTVTPQPPGPGEAPPTAADGSSLDPDQPIAMSRIAFLSENEAWIEGIRVDPRVRGRSVATLLQVAEFAWVAAHGSRVIRYVTNGQNEGSHRLGGRHGFRLLNAWRSYGPDDDEPRAVGGGNQALRARLAADGLVLDATSDASSIERWWARLSTDGTFRAANGLYESKPWKLQRLTAELFAAHVRAGEVLAVDRPNGWALAVLPFGGVEDDELPFVCALTGAARTAVELVTALNERARSPARIRLPDPDPPLLRDGGTELFEAAGYPAHPSALHTLERRLDDGAPLPEATDLLVLEDAPRRIARPSG